MKTQMLLIAVLTIVCATIAGCEPGNDSTGTSTVVVGGDTETYDWARADRYEYGETAIGGLYATGIGLYFEKSSAPDHYMNIDITLFHTSEQFSTGTYTFPSTGPGTARGTVSMNSGDGGIASGSIAVSVSGGQYTITLRDVVFGYPGGETQTIDLTYKGELKESGRNDDPEPPLPDFSGQSTIVERVSGRTAANMTMIVIYYGELPDNGLHSNIIQLTSEEENGTSFDIQIILYSETSDLTPGTYTAPGLRAGAFYGTMGFRHEREDGSFIENVSDLSGEIVVSESDGTYTIEFNEVSGDEGTMVFDGTYTGICAEFHGI